MDAEKFEIIKKLLEVRIKSEQYFIGLWKKECSKHPTDHFNQRVLSGHLSSYFAYRTMLDWLNNEDLLRHYASMWLN